MITYDTLRELAHALSMVTGYRYVAYHATDTADLFIDFSNFEMEWYYPYGFWTGGLDRQVLDLRDIPDLDWSKCQFDCKEADNEKES